MKIVFKLFTLLTLTFMVSCSSNAFKRTVQQNHENNWIEKEHTYRSLSSIDEKESNSKK